MSDCRYGVSPVNYPDPDPDARPKSCSVCYDTLIRCEPLTKVCVLIRLILISQKITDFELIRAFA